MPLLGHEYQKLSFEKVKRHLKGLDIEVVGGLKGRGWTTHDIDVVGKREDIPIFAERLKADAIPHPVHYCRKQPYHSHLHCAWNGIKLAFTGKGY